MRLSNPTAEAAVLAAVLTDATILPVVQEMVPTDAFADQSLAAIWRAVMSIRLDGRPIDEVVLAHELVRRGDDKYIGSKVEAIRMMKNLKDEYGKGDYQAQARIVRDLYVRRRTVDDLRRIAMDIGGLDQETTVVLNRLQKEAAALVGMADYEPAVPIGNFVDIVLDDLIDAKSRPDGAPGITTGWEEVDAFYKFTPGRIYFVASRPGDGKTTAMMNMVEAAADAGHKPFIQSLEMTGREIVSRVMYTRANVPLADGEAGTTDDIQDQRIVEAGDYLKSKDILIDDKSSLTALDIRSRILENVRRGSNIAFVDHLHEVARRTPAPGERMGSIDQIAEAVVVLADTAKELNIPVVVMAQMNREIEKRNRKHGPVMSDLKGAGKIEERAYVVMFLHPRRKDETDTDVPTDFIIRKNRTGSPGTIAMIFEKDRGRFIAHIEDEPERPQFNAFTERKEKDDED